MTIEILDRATIVKKISSVKGRAATVRADIDQLAKSCIVHAGEHGDLTLASKLTASVSKSYATDLRKYFTTFAPVRWDKKAGGFKKLAKGGQFNIGGAMDTAFDNVEPEAKDAPEYNRAKEIASIVKFLDTKADRAINAGDETMTALLVELASALGKVDA